METIKKFSDVELSRILSAHSGGQLAAHGDDWLSEVPFEDMRVFGFYHNPKACLIQAGKLVDDPSYASDMNETLAHNFDVEYNRKWSVPEFIEWLNVQGVI